MDTRIAYEEVYIKSLGSRVKVRILAPTEMEALESMSECEREAELLLQGIYNPGELVKQLTKALGRDLVNLILSPDHESFEDKLRQIRNETLDAICEVNELAHLKLRKCEFMETDLGRCVLRLSVDGKLLISPLEDIGKTDSTEADNSGE